MKGVGSQPLERDVLFRVADQVGGPTLKREVSTLFALQALQPPVVLVLGLVKRGKSTLVNQVLKKKLSPTGRLPETASLISYQHGRKRRASALSLDQKSRSINRTAPGFRRAVSRTRAKDLLVASYEGPVQLAEGITLVDTAGAEESVGSARSLDVSGAAEAVLAHADAAIMVIGSPPGVSGPELQYLRHVLKTVGPDRVQVVIKSLSSEVGRGDLIDLQGYLEEMSDLAKCAKNAILVADSDTASIDAVRNWINRLTKSTRYWSTTIEAKASSAVIEQVRALDSSTNLDISDRELSVLWPELATEVRKFTSQGRRDAENARLKADYEIALADYNERYVSWSAERDTLLRALSTKQREHAKIRVDLDLSRKESRKGSVGIGCLFFFLFPLSFVAFPFGPLAAVAILLVNLGVRSDRLKELEKRSQRQGAPVVSQIQNLKRQLELLDERRPLEPVTPTYLRPRRRELKGPNRFGRFLRRGVMAASSLALASVGLWFLLAATLPSKTLQRDSSELPITVAESTVPVTTPQMSLRGLVTGTKSSGLAEAEVRLVQQLLMTECCPDVVVDGVWGQQTEAAVDELREKMKLQPGFGVDGPLWSALMRRPALADIGVGVKDSLVGGIFVPERMILIKEMSELGGDSSQVFLLPYLSSGGTERWLREKGAGEPEGEWLQCQAESTAPNSYQVSWISSDGRLLSIWAGISPEERDEIQIEIRSTISSEDKCQ